MTMMKRIGLSTFFILLGCILCNAASVGYDVVSQQEFEVYMKKAQSGEPIEISLAKGNYVLKSPIIARAPFSINGNGSTITYANDKYTCEDAVRRTADHYICKLRENITFLFVDGKGNILPVSESVQEDKRVNTCEQIDGEYAAKPGAELKIPISRNISGLANNEFSKAYGYFDCAWQ